MLALERKDLSWRGVRAGGDLDGPWMPGWTGTKLPASSVGHGRRRSSLYKRLGADQDRWRTQEAGFDRRGELWWKHSRMIAGARLNSLELDIAAS